MFIRQPNRGRFKSWNERNDEARRTLKKRIKN